MFGMVVIYDRKLLHFDECNPKEDAIMKSTNKKEIIETRKTLK